MIAGIGILRHQTDGSKVAIVGNARSLSQQPYGSLIDSHDIIVRLNTAPGCQPSSHGAKTTWLAISKYVTSTRLRELRPQTVIWMTPKRRWQTFPMLLTPEKFCYYPTASWQDLSVKLGGSRPSTGAMTIDLLLRFDNFARLSLFGFDFFKSGSLSNTGLTKASPHDFDRERIFVSSLLESDSRIELHAQAPGAQ